MIVAFADFVFDADTHELRRGRERLPLPLKAFSLLALLIERRPCVVSQAAIYDHLWPDTHVDVANLHKLISTLRVVLDDRDHKIIRTVHGFGFAFAAPTVHTVPPQALSERRAPARLSLAVGTVQFPLPPGVYTVGRGCEVPVRIDDASISRCHARLLVGTERMTVEDLDSKNGTFVNGERISSPTEVAPDDFVLFGRVHAHLILDSPNDADVQVTDTLIAGIN